nr:MAG TPA: hypothetical protein [Caudoviricetes sp.]
MITTCARRSSRANDWTTRSATDRPQQRGRVVPAGLQRPCGYVCRLPSAA